jgi:uncharacterized membrane protein YkvA (DUF1232 family)
MAGTVLSVSRGRRRRRGSLLRALRWLAFVPLASRAPTYSRLIWSLATDPRVPGSRKAILVGAAGYVLVGRDLVPDDIPLVGAVDDLAVIVLAVEIFFDGIPDDILDEKLVELEINRDAFRRDMDQVRRVTPAPVRRLIRRVPDAIEATGRLVGQTQIGPRVRSLVNKEETFA